MQHALVLLADALRRVVGRLVGLLRGLRRRVAEPHVLDPHAALVRRLRLPLRQRPGPEPVVQHARVQAKQDVHAHRAQLQLRSQNDKQLLQTAV